MMEPKKEPKIDDGLIPPPSVKGEVSQMDLSTAEEDEEAPEIDYGYDYDLENDSSEDTDSDMDIFSVKKLFPETVPKWNAQFEEKRVPQPSSSKEQSVENPVNEAAEIDQEEFGLAETYSDYEPAKLKIGKRHPDPIVESSSLASVTPNDISYSLILPDSVIDSGALSTVQLEAVIYIAQQHERFLPDGARAGFLLGDGTGVGKGRTVAGVIYDNYLRGRKKSLWFSVSNDLKFDSERDLKDVGASRIKVHSLNKMEYTKMDSYLGGNVQEGVIYSTYSSLIGKTVSSSATFRSRLDQLVHWCGEDFDGPIIFDESHRAKNLCPGGNKKSTKTGLAVEELQNKLPKARIVYVSATGASELKNMAYMVRLGMWGKGTPFRHFFEFLAAIEKRGVGAMEIVAIDMKLRGMYMARQLSFKGVTFRIEDALLDSDFVQMYNDSVDLWVEIKEKLSDALDPFEDNFYDDDPDESSKGRTGNKMVWSQFWGAHQRFFKYLCIASKVKRTIELTKEAIKDGKCVVIGLLATGEAQTLNKLERDEGELTEFISTAKGVLRNFVEKFYPVPEEPEPTENSRSDWTGIDESDLSASEASDSSDSVDSDELLWEGLKHGKKRPAQKTKGKGRTKRAKVEPPKKKKVNRLEDPILVDLLEKIEELGKRLPANTLDQLIDELGGPGIVGEMTGRKGRIVQTNGTIEYESRAGEDAPIETLNLVEKQKFMDDEKNIVIISEAASSGISLQSDKRAKNQRRRVHITLEMPWSADKAMQQFGRTHRSNQASAPEYVFLISDLAGERRFASTVAKQLESLGALTHGDRRATETRDLSQFNVYNKYGVSALTRTICGIVGIEPPLLLPPSNYPGDFFQDMQAALISVGLFKVNVEGAVEPEKEATKLTRFLNRILGLKVDHQNSLFNYFNSILATLVAKAKKENKFDLGIRDMGSAGEEIKRVKSFTYVRPHMGGVARTQLDVFHVERGMPWEKAFAKYAELSGPEEGFYVSHNPWRNGKRTAVLAVFSPHDKHTRIQQSSDGTDIRDSYLIFKPNIGQQPTKEALLDLRKRYVKASASVAEECWKHQYDLSDKMCTHTYWNGSCRTVMAGIRCEFGLRQLTHVILSGSVLNIWTRIEAVLAAKHGSTQKFQVVRLKTTDGYKTIGTIIPNDCVHALKAELSVDCANTSEATFVPNSKAYMPENLEILPPSRQKCTRQKKPAQKKPVKKRPKYGGWRRRF